jgi:enoyl-CoA hydratase/carnithine racemase
VSEVTVHRDAAILRITLDRPAKKNAVTLPMYDAVATALREADADAGVRVIVIDGAGGAFTAGNDLAAFQSTPLDPRDNPIFRFLNGISRVGKPLVAAVEGVAVGIGTTMLLHCELVYAAEDAKFALPFVNLALCPEAASTFLLPAIAGYQRAAELFLFAEPFDARRAQAVGFVNEVVPPGQALERAMTAARKIAEKPPAAVRLTKALMKRALAAQIEAAMRDENAGFVEGLKSPEAKEAFAAFFEKRKPDFSKFG